MLISAVIGQTLPVTPLLIILKTVGYEKCKNKNSFSTNLFSFNVLFLKHSHDVTHVRMSSYCCKLSSSGFAICYSVNIINLFVIRSDILVCDERKLKNPVHLGVVSCCFHPLVGTKRMIFYVKIVKQFQ